LITLPPLLRQAIAGTAAAAVFLALFFGSALAWWVSLLGGGSVYLAVLMLTDPIAPEPTVGPDGVSDDDIRAAVDRLTAAAVRLRAAALKARGPEKTTFKRMAELVEAIRGHHLADRRDYRHTRSFINTSLDRMVESVEGYVELDAKARGQNRERLGEVRERIEGFVPALEKIDQACLENDFMALEVQVEVLDEQLQRR